MALDVKFHTVEIGQDVLLFFLGKVLLRLEILERLGRQIGLNGDRQRVEPLVQNLIGVRVVCISGEGCYYPPSPRPARIGNRGLFWRVCASGGVAFVLGPGRGPGLFQIAVVSLHWSASISSFPRARRISRCSEGPRVRRSWCSASSLPCRGMSGTDRRNRIRHCPKRWP